MPYPAFDPRNDYRTLVPAHNAVSQLDGFARKIDDVITVKYVTPETKNEFYDYLIGRSNSQNAKTSDEVLSRLAEQGVTPESMVKILDTPEKASVFLTLFMDSAAKMGKNNPGAQNYFSDTKVQQKDAEVVARSIAVTLSKIDSLSSQFYSAVRQTTSELSNNLVTKDGTYNANVSILNARPNKLTYTKLDRDWETAE